ITNRSVDDLDLFGTLDHDLQAVLRMIFNGADYFHVLVFEILRRLLVLLEKLDGGIKYDGGESLAERPEVEKVGVALGGMTDAKNPPSYARLFTGKSANFLHLTGNHHGSFNVGFLGCWQKRQGYKIHSITLRLAESRRWPVLIPRHRQLRFRCRRVPALVKHMAKKAAEKQ